MWCGREDSNFHGLSATATSTLRVYQFRHDRTREYAGHRPAPGKARASSKAVRCAQWRRRVSHARQRLACSNARDASVARARTRATQASLCGTMNNPPFTIARWRLIQSACCSFWPPPHLSRCPLRAPMPGSGQLRACRCGSCQAQGSSLAGRPKHRASLSGEASSGSRTARAKPHNSLNSIKVKAVPGQVAGAPSDTVNWSAPLGTLTSALLKLALAPAGKVRAGGAMVQP